MVDLGRDEVQAIADDDDASISKRMAAQMLLDAIDDDAEVRRRTTTEVMDRTTGKAQQHISVEGDGAQPTLVQIIEGKAPRAKPIEADSPNAKLLAGKSVDAPDD